MKRFASIVASLVMVITLLGPTIVHAQSSNDSTSAADRIASDPILSGLWSGVNLSFGSSSGGSQGGSSGGSPTTPPLPTKGAYVALGDSVAAGVGLSTPSTVPSAEVRCGRTAEAYPHAVARAMNLPLIHKACSGATTRDFYTRDWYPSPSLPAQLNTAFAGGTPRLITITSGANDINWERFLRTCASSSNCDRTNGTFITGLMELTQSRLMNVFEAIRLRSGTTPPTVVITGYYNPVSTTCTTRYPSVTAEEIAWLSARVSDLNQSIQEAALGYSFVRFAPVDFTGHDICSTQPWVQNLSDARPIHPTASGQRVMAQAVLRSLNR